MCTHLCQVPLLLRPPRLWRRRGGGGRGFALTYGGRALGQAAAARIAQVLLLPAATLVAAIHCLAGPWSTLLQALGTCGE